VPLCWNSIIVYEVIPSQRLPMNTPGSMTTTPYEQDVLSWRQWMDERLRADDGWLTLVGLFWLREGENTIGSDPGADIQLPPGKSPGSLGILTLEADQVKLVTAAESVVEIDGVPRREAILLPDTDDAGPSYVNLHSITFYVIKRGPQYGIRVRDRENASRVAFGGRQWFPIDPSYVIAAAFHPYPSPRSINIINAVGITVPMENPGYAEFSLGGHTTRLEAFEGDAATHTLWFVFKDATNGSATYGAGRFLDAPLSEDGIVTLDFNKAYNPPCAFTAFATCPLPPRENILLAGIEAGEKLPGALPPQ